MLFSEESSFETEIKNSNIFLMFSVTLNCPLTLLTRSTDSGKSNFVGSVCIVGREPVNCLPAFSDSAVILCHVIRLNFKQTNAPSVCLFIYISLRYVLQIHG
jgi:hypothetical protein